MRVARASAALALVVAVWTASAPATPAAVAVAPSNPALAGSVSNGSSLSGATAVAVAGNYAYTTAYWAGTLTAIDVSNPAQTQIAGQSAFSTNLVNASTVNVANGYAYVVSKNSNQAQGTKKNDDGTGNSLTILDIHTNPAVPAIVGTIRDAVNLFGAYGIATSGNYAFVAAQGCLSSQPCPNPSVGDAFDVVNVSVPSNPTIVATLRNSALAGPWAGTDALKHATSVALAGNYAYVTAAYSDRLTVIDVSDPLHPAIVASLQDSVQLDFPVDVAVQNGLAYVTDQATNLGRVAVVDVSNPAAPHVVGSVTNKSWLNGAYRIRVLGNFAYVAGSASDTMAVVDISDPANLRVAGGYRSSPVLNHTTGVDVDPTGHYAVASSPSLSTETKPLYPPYPLQPGGPPATGTVATITLDPSPIKVTITASSKPPASTTQIFANFAFTTTDVISTVRCKLDTSLEGLCTSPTTQAYSGLLSGSHTFTVRAIDAAGVSSSASYTWTVTAQPPANTIAPTVSGQAVVGQLLTASPGTWTGNPVPTLTYQWQDCDSSGQGCAPIEGATSPFYTVGASDVGSTLLVTVTGTNPSGSIPVNSAATGVVAQPGSAPVSTVAPTVSGQAVVGQVLTASPGTWTGNPAPSFAYQWKDCDSSGQSCVSIGGATSASYTVASSDVGFTLLVVVTGTNASGSSSASSAPTGVVPQPPSAPVNTVAPVISGQATVGQVLSASTGTWTGNPAPTFAYEWQDCDPNGLNCVAIDGATTSSYTVATGDVGSTLVIAVTGTNPSGSSSASSAATAVVPPAGSAPVNTGAPVVSGQAVVGQVLSASDGTWTGTPAPTFAYQWQDCDSNGLSCVPIGGATSSSYTVAQGDVGSTLVIAVTGTNPSGSSSASSTPTSVVPNPGSPPVNTVAPVVTGQATVGQVLAASTGTWTGNPAPTLTYQWQDCDSAGQNCASIGGATSASYTVASSDVGFTLVVAVTGTNGSGSSSASSTATGVVPQPGSPPVNTVAPVVTGQATVGQVLSASNGTWTGTPAPSFAYQWKDCDTNGQNCTPIGGATSSSYTVAATDVGFTLVVAVTGTNASGSSSAGSAPTSVVAWLAPVSPILDTFNRANGAAGSNWSLIGSTSFAAMNVSGQTAVDSSTTKFAWNFWNAASFGPNVEAYCTISTAGADTFRIGARVTGGTASYTGYFASITGTGAWSIIRIDAGAPTTLASGVTQTLAAGDKIAIRIIGSRVTALHYTTAAQWSQVLSYDTAADTVKYTGAGRIATEFRAGAIDDFGGGSL